MIKSGDVLKRYVKRIASFDHQEYSKSHHHLKCFADGSPGIMFQQGESPMMINSSGKLPAVFLYGQTVSPVMLSTNGPYRAVIAFLQPYALEPLFGISARDLTDTCVDLSLLNIVGAFSLPEHMLNAESQADSVRIMENFLMTLIIKKKTRPKSEIPRAIELIHQFDGNKSVVDIARALQLSERTLVRYFDQCIGVSPKLYSNICKFKSALQRLESGKFDSLSGLAYALGYADQSHFNRWFKSFTSETPLEFLNSMQQARSHVSAIALEPYGA